MAKEDIQAGIENVATQTQALIDRVATEGVTDASGKTVIAPTTPPNAGDLGSATDLTIPTTSPDISGIEGADAFNAAAKVKQDEADKAAADKAALEAATPERPRSFTEFITGQGKKKPEDVREEKETALGVDEAEFLAEKKAARAEIETLSADYNKLFAAKEQQIADFYGRPGITQDFLNNAVAQINRNAAVQLNAKAANINAKAATLAAISEDFVQASQLVDKAVDSYTAGLKDDYTVFSDFITTNEAKISKLDIKYQNSLDSAMDLKLKQYQETKVEQTNVGNLMIEFPRAGINIGDTIAEAQLKASKAAALIQPEADTQVVKLDDGSTVLINSQTGNIISTIDDTADASIDTREFIDHPTQPGVSMPNPNFGKPIVGDTTMQTLNGKSLNDAQALSFGYATRMNNADAIISGFGSEFTGALDVISGSKFFPNIFKSEDRQSYEQAQRNFVNAVLRKESGAAISPEEFKSASQQYFPQPGDNDVVVEQKASNRQTAIANIARSANVPLSEITGQSETTSGGGSYQDYLNAIK